MRSSAEVKTERRIQKKKEKIYFMHVFTFMVIPIFFLGRFSFFILCFESIVI